MSKVLRSLVEFPGVEGLARRMAGDDARVLIVPHFSAGPPPIP